MTRSEMSMAEQVTAFRIEDELVANRVMEEATAAQYAGVCIARARDYAAHLATMAVHPYLQIWAIEMTSKHGTATPKVHHNYLPWIAALMVARYGEAVASWPAATSDDDVKRAREWKTGGGRGMPRFVQV